MKYSVSAACGCHVGKKRKNNEDNFYFNGKYMESSNNGTDEVLIKKDAKNFIYKTLINVDDNYEFYAVFDGMGGGEYGEIASYTAAERSNVFMKNRENINPNDITPTLKKLCDYLNRNVCEAGSERDAEQMGSTLVSLFCYNEQAWICNLGDSGCYALRNKQLQKVSKDHIGRYNNGGGKPYLTQYLGIDPNDAELEPYVRSFYPEYGDLLLLCSDGLTDLVSEDNIKEIMLNCSSLEKCVRSLIQTALDNGGTDNITVMICKIEK